ncbi:MAG: PAS domain S-box protein [Nitrospirae bacterium]|nr:PAS domain S-box protein [Nitrospirota bacterium]
MAEYALTGRLKALIGFRALFVSLLLGSAFLLRIEFFPNPKAISFFIIALYLLTIVYALLIQRIRHLHVFAYIQLILDVIAEIALIYITGGIESWFPFTLILTVISSSIVLNRRAGYVMASMGSILYGALLDLQFYRVLPLDYQGVMQEKQFLYNIFIHTVSLFVTAYLTGYLSTRLEKTEERLEQKDTHLRDLELFNMKVIESLPSGLFTTDREGNVLIFNKAAETITGISQQEIIGQNITQALPSLTYPFRAGRNEETLLLSGQQKKIIGINMSILKDTAQKETGYIGIFQDLTQLKELEAEMKDREKWAAIGELSANIAHEIRNPLASLRGSIEMLKEGKIPERHRDKLMEIAISEMQRLNNIVTDFLTYSRPRPLEIHEVDLHGLLRNTLSLLENTAQKIKIKQAFEGTMLVRVDPEAIRQVFWNLGTNAADAMVQGGVLTVSTRDFSDRVSVIFSDTGPGISQQDLSRIFYPFYTTKEGGTGLGLSIAHRIVEEHRGKLAAESTPGIGTTFEIILPKAYGA